MLQLLAGNYLEHSHVRYRRLDDVVTSTFSMFSRPRSTELHPRGILLVVPASHEGEPGEASLVESISEGDTGSTSTSRLRDV